jgi:hypothetical protein
MAKFKFWARKDVAMKHVTMRLSDSIANETKATPISTVNPLHSEIVLSNQTTGNNRPNSEVPSSAISAVEADSCLSAAYQIVAQAGSSRVNAHYFCLKLCSPAENESCQQFPNATKRPANTGDFAISLYQNRCFIIVRFLPPSASKSVGTSTSDAGEHLSASE